MRMNVGGWKGKPDTLGSLLDDPVHVKLKNGQKNSIGVGSDWGLAEGTPGVGSCQFLTLGASYLVPSSWR